jgi:urease accessory protein
LILERPRLGGTQHGELELVFEARGGKTVLVKGLQKPPLLFIRPFELEPGTLTVIIVNPTAGILAGDTYKVSVTLLEGARMVLLTQSATKIHKMNDGLNATQDISFYIANNSRLEYYPERTIPYALSNFKQRLNVNLELGAQFGMLETWTTGRVLRGERLEFTRYASRTSVRINNKLEYLDSFTLEPASSNLNALGALEGHDYIASGLFVGNHSPLPEFEGVSTGLTANNHLWLRAVAKNAPDLDRSIFHARDAIRAALFGVGKLELRRS